MSYKNINGFQWAVKHCLQAQMLIKIDDDTVMNLPEVLALAPPLLKNGTLVGGIKYDAIPQRGGNGKWDVSQQEWPGTTYPHYLVG